MRDLGRQTFTCSSQGIVYVVPVFAAFFGVGAAVLLLLARARGFQASSPLTWAAPAAGLMAFLLAAAAVVVVRRWRTYGASTLEIVRLPGADANVLAGRIVAAPAAGEQQRFVLTLSEKARTWGTAGGKREAFDRTVWSRSVTLDPGTVAARGEGCVIPFEVEIPAGDAPGDPQESRWWSLQVEATGPRPKYFADFTLAPPGTFTAP